MSPVDISHLAISGEFSATTAILRLSFPNLESLFVQSPSNLVSSGLLATILRSTNRLTDLDLVELDGIAANDSDDYLDTLQLSGQTVLSLSVITRPYAGGDGLPDRLLEAFVQLKELTIQVDDNPDLARILSFLPNPTLTTLRIPGRYPNYYLDSALCGALDELDALLRSVPLASLKTLYISWGRLVPEFSMKLEPHREPVENGDLDEG